MYTTAPRFAGRWLKSRIVVTDYGLKIPCFVRRHRPELHASTYSAEIDVASQIS